MEMVTVDAPYRPGFNYGIGVQGASADTRDLAVEGALSAPTDAGGDTVTFQLRSVQTTSDIESSLSISADASGGIGLFSGSDKFDFAKECQVQSSSLCLVVYCSRKKAFQQIDSPRLNADAAALVSAGKLDDFAARYGDRFVRGMQTGGQFLGIYRIDVKNESSRQRIDNALGGSYGLFSGEAHANLLRVCTSENAHIYCDAYFEGGNVTTTGPDTPEKLMAAMDEWAKTIDAFPRPYTVSLAPYVIAQGPLPPNMIDLQHQKDILMLCARLRSLTLDNLNLVEYITSPDHRDEFSSPTIWPDFGLVHTGLSGDLDVIAAAASYALDNPKTALDPESFARTTIRSAEGNVIRAGQANYSLTKMPDMPKHEGASVTVPNFATAGSVEEAVKLAGQNLKLHWIDDNQINDTFQVVKQDLAPGTSVSPGDTVTLTTHVSRMLWTMRRGSARI